LQLCPKDFRGSGAWRLRFSLAPCIHKVSQLLSSTIRFRNARGLLSLTPRVNLEYFPSSSARRFTRVWRLYLSLTPLFSEVWRSDEMFSTVSTVSLIDYFSDARAFSIRKKKVLLQYKEMFFDRLTPMHLLHILHSQFSAFAQQ
jgi:hypothetical protein